MKVVINDCYGGFSLSLKGLKEYLKLKGKKAYFYSQTKFKHSDGMEKHVRVGVNEKSCFVHCVLQNLGTEVTGDFGKAYDDGNYFSIYDIPRDDADLVKVVEKLGKKSWGNCAKLKIVEIPDGIEWHLDEYDGNEHIAEKHRTWN